MKWEGNRQSDNVEDRRGSGGTGGGGMRIGGRGIGIGTIVIALVGGWILGINPLTLLGALSGGGAIAPSAQQAPAQAPPAVRGQATTPCRRAGSQVAGQLGEQAFGGRPDPADTRAVRGVGVAVPGDEVLQRELVDAVVVLGGDAIL